MAGGGRPLKVRPPTPTDPTGEGGGDRSTPTGEGGGAGARSASGDGLGLELDGGRCVTGDAVSDDGAGLRAGGRCPTGEATGDGLSEPRPRAPSRRWPTWFRGRVGVLGVGY